MNTKIFNQDAEKGSTNFSYHYVNKDFPQKHNHQYWEFFVITEGIVEHKINDLKYEMKKGNACLVRPNDTHCFCNKNKQSSQHINIMMQSDFIQKMSLVISPDLFISMLEYPSALLINLDKLQYDRIINYITMLQTNELINTQSIDMVQNFLSLNILEIICSKYFLSVKGYPQWLNDFLIELNKPENTSISANEACLLSHYSIPQLSRLFKKHTGMTLINYLTKKRMNNAMELLRNSNMSTLEISGFLGYDSLSHFNHIFKIYTGVTPKQYRDFKNN